MRPKPLKRSYPCLPQLTGNQRYGNTLNQHSHSKPTHGHNRPASKRHFSDGQRAVDSHAARLDETPAHSASPPWSLCLLRPRRSLGSYPYQTKGAGPRLIHSTTQTRRASFETARRVSWKTNHPAFFNIMSECHLSGENHVPTLKIASAPLGESKTTRRVSARQM